MRCWSIFHNITMIAYWSSLLQSFELNREEFVLYGVLLTLLVALRCCADPLDGQSAIVVPWSSTRLTQRENAYDWQRKRHYMMCWVKFWHSFWWLQHMHKVSMDQKECRKLLMESSSQNWALLFERHLPSLILEPANTCLMDFSNTSNWICSWVQWCCHCHSIL